METYDPNMSAGAAAAVGIGAMIFGLVIGLIVHFFYGYCFKMMAEKTGHSESAGLWWIPIANWLIPLRIAGKPGWWLILFLVPFVNFIVLIIVFMKVAEARGKESWWGIVAAFVSIVGIPYLAFSE